jgi:rare lipoprotein A
MKNSFMVLAFFLLLLCVSCVTPSGPVNRTASGGATYNADEPGLKAAHAELEFDTRVRVTNLYNNRAVIVTITDRIPFDPERIIHIGKMAGDNIDMSPVNSTPVLIEVLGRPKTSRQITLSATN